MNKLPDLMAAIRALDMNEVLVGVPEKNDTRDEADGPNNAELAYIQNTGSPANNIPPRPFLAEGIENVHERLTKRLLQTAQKALEGDLASVEKGLMGVGQIAVDGVKDKILTGPFQGLAPRTLAARRKRGVTRTEPLRDTGQMLNAMTYVLRKRRKKGK